MKLIKQSDYKVMPWKNGKGITAEIAKFPEASAFPDGDFVWRLSSAKVDSSDPFSRFPNCDRLLVVWKGQGLLLNEVPLLPEQPHLFNGEDSIYARLLNGPVVDVGLIYRRDKVSAQMTTERLSGGEKIEKVNRGTLIIFCAEGCLQAGDLVLHTGDSLCVDDAEHVLLKAAETSVYFSMDLRIL